MARRLPLLFILCLGFALRLNGLTWGLPSDDFPFSPLHPDERFVMDTLQQMNWSQGDFNPDQAHREGTLAYYIWAGVGFALKTAGIVPAMPWEAGAFDSRYGTFILSMRATNIVLDTLGILLVYLTVQLLAANELAALLGALLFAVTPFEIIYAHYARTHSLSNFFLLLVFAASARLCTSRGVGWSLLTGALCGMAAASRYPTGVGIIVPIAVVAFRNRGRERDPATNERSIAVHVSAIAIAAFGAFFLCDPYLFLDFETARKALAEQASFIDRSQLTWAGLFDPSKLRAYLTYLFPYGTLPFLWVLFYASVVFLVLWPPLYRITAPLLAFLFVYFMAMAKGYTTELVFIRGMMGLFPPLCILSGIALGTWWAAAARSRFRAAAWVAGLACVVLSTIGYDLAYTNAMRRPDVRVTLARQLQSETSGSDIRVGLFPYCRNFIAINPTLEALPGKRVSLDLREDLLSNPADVDYVVLPAFEPAQFDVAAARAEDFTSSGKYMLSGIYHNPVTFLGYEFSNRNNPHDLQYPFPTLYLLKRVRS